MSIDTLISTCIKVQVVPAPLRVAEVQLMSVLDQRFEFFRGSRVVGRKYASKNRNMPP